MWKYYSIIYFTHNSTWHCWKSVSQFSLTLGESLRMFPARDSKAVNDPLITDALLVLISLVTRPLAAMAMEDGQYSYLNVSACVSTLSYL